MLRFTPPTVAFLVFGTLLAALLTWADVFGEKRGAASPSAVSRLLPRDALNRQQQLKAEIDAGLAREQQLDELVEEVAAGRLSLLAAAGRARAVWQGMPDDVWNGLRARMPNATDEERLCRLLIGKVQVSQWRDPGRAAVAARLTAELDEQLKRGPLRLPGPGE